MKGNSNPDPVLGPSGEANEAQSIEHERPELGRLGWSSTLFHETRCLDVPLRVSAANIDLIQTYPPETAGLPEFATANPDALQRLLIGNLNHVTDVGRRIQQRRFLLK
jgi:hypothetical protein